MEPQQIQSMRSLAPIKVEQQQSDPSLFLQQQQQLLQMSRQSSQAAAAHLLHQQRLMQFQHHHQLLKTISQQRNPLQQQFQPQNLAVRPPVKALYKPGMCAHQLTHYMYQQLTHYMSNGCVALRNMQPQARPWVRFLALSTGIIYYYYALVLKVDEEEFGGHGALLQEGLFASITLFVASQLD